MTAEEYQNPDIVALKHIEKLSETPTEVLSDLGEADIVAISMFKALNEHNVNIPSVIQALNNIMALRGSYRRLGRGEFITALKGMRTGFLLRAGQEEEEPPKNRSLLDKLIGR